MTPSMLLAYDSDGSIIATLDHMVARDADGLVTGLIDFDAHELAGGRLRDIWDVAGAAGSGTWPEWIGARAHDFRVELGPDKRISALVHGKSGYRRERSAIMDAISSAPPTDNGGRDIRAIVGGPGLPLMLDDQGRTVGRSPRPSGTPGHLPLLGRPSETP